MAVMIKTKGVTISEVDMGIVLSFVSTTNEEIADEVADKTYVYCYHLTNPLTNFIQVELTRVPYVPQFCQMLSDALTMTRGDGHVCDEYASIPWSKVFDDFLTPDKMPSIDEEAVSLGSNDDMDWVSKPNVEHMDSSVDPLASLIFSTKLACIHMTQEGNHKTATFTHGHPIS
jgi:hypothetical protein